MLLSEYIDQHGIEAVAKFLLGRPDFRVFNLLWQAPEEILPACRRMGLQSVEDVVAWIGRINAAVGSTEAFAELIDPALPLDLGSMPTIQWPEIHAALAAQCRLSADLQIHHSDRTYRLPTRLQWEAIGRACPSVRRKHTGDDTHDCDDFTRHCLGWLAGKGLGNLAAGFAATVHYLNGTVLGGHAVVLVLDADRRVWMLEPQNGRLYAPTYSALGGFLLANEVQVARAYY